MRVVRRLYVCCMQDKREQRDVFIFTFPLSFIRYVLQDQRQTIFRTIHLSTRAPRYLFAENYKLRHRSIVSFRKVTPLLKYLIYGLCSIHLILN